MTTITAEVKPALLSVLASLGLPPRSCVYVSTPISTGSRYLQWRETARDSEPGTESFEAGRCDVKRANIHDAKTLIASIRSTFNDTLVIDPTALADITGWQQHDYHLYWTDIMAKYVHTAVFANGWQYSEGCAIEFATATELQVNCIDHMSHQMDSAAGLRMIEEAILQYRRIDYTSTTLGDVAANLRNFNSRIV